MERAVERLSELQDKLASLQDALEQLKEHIARLANFDFQSGDLDDTATSELSTEIIQLIQEQEEDLDLLHEEIADIRPFKALKHDKDRLQDGAERLKEELHGCRPLLRKAQVRAKHNLQQAQKRERELLWASFSQSRSAKTSGTSSPRPVEKPRRKPRSEMSKDEQAVASSSDVTLALRRTHDMMAAELSRSDFARKTLQESTAALAQLGESYSSLDTMLASSRDLLGTLMRSQKSDTWYLQTSFYMLVLTNCWLIFRRLLYGPLWWLVWLPLRLVFRGAVTVTSLGRHGGQEALVVPPDGKPVEPSMNNEGVPTIQAGQPQETTEMIVDPGNDESMVEEIGRMIDESKQGNSEVFDNEAGVVVEEVQDIPALEPERVRVEL
ncbi:hypothetical protein BKA67DRAFT_530032 [Truncatella angustata]|uniref:Sec20 C-terminal domain-containing protein n=1 Tax=Truncatella angustata TaxID=152316 RepID=A0A9P8UX07_9PEZI|nr:uncharacterized protein BKA67DRAFT_530032 [Truncatella angustata]KAH6659907.1 hypothetical protein BKA67DRAFT_530032 [Truncatella angustata]KAH8197531.1 hypothetical protein TruAng_008314 [Truncatella angustata]